MSIDKKDREMMSLSVPVVDYFEMKDEIDRLSSTVERLETAIQVLTELYRTERVKTWEIVLREMLNQMEKGETRNGFRTGGLGPKPSNTGRSL
jgi:hypothetical protein